MASHIVPELGPEVKFSYASHKAVNEYKKAKALGVDTVPVFVGPVSYLLLSKPAKGVEKTVDLLSLLDKILPIYKEVIAELKAAGATWIQFDEATLVKDPEAHQLAAFTKAYKELQSACSGVNFLFATYFADIPADAFKVLTTFPGVAGYTFDLVPGEQTLDLIKTSFPSGKFVDGRNIWANDLAGSLSVLESLESVDLVNETEIKSLLACDAQKVVVLVASALKVFELGASALENIVGKDKLVVSTSSSQQHTAVDLLNKTKIKSWLAFAAQKVVKLVASAQEAVELVAFALKVVEFGASALKYHEVKPALENMVTAAKKLGAALASAK